MITAIDSNILIDPAQELRALEYSQRLAHQAMDHDAVLRRIVASCSAADYSKVSLAVVEREQALAARAGV
jgi:hypothetical protein